jgi:hypothetical protein
MSKKPLGLEVGGSIGSDGKLQFFEVSFVADPPDPNARIWPTCKSCGTMMARGRHPENGCEMTDVFNTHES